MTPRRDTPGTRARRALLVDLLLAAGLAALALWFAAGLGVVGAFALPVLLIGLLWVAAERLVDRIRVRRA